MMAMGETEARGSAMVDDPSLFEAWPANLAPAMLRIDYGRLSSIDKLASWDASSAYFKTRFPHHALVDARAHALCAKAAIESNPGLQAHRPEDFCKTFKTDPARLAWSTARTRKNP
jgi:hypothetical protein